MGLNVKTGTFTFASTDTGQKQIRSVGFTPKLVLLYAGQGAAEDTWADDASMLFGYMTAAEQVTVGMVDEDAVLDSNTGSGRNSSSVLRGYSDGAPTIDFDLTPGTTRFVSDGFDLTVTDAPAADRIIHWVALGGDDISAVKGGSFTPTGTSVGNTQDVTVAASWGQPDLLLFFTIPINSGIDVDTANFGGICFGAAASDNERASMGYFHNDGETSMDTSSWLAARAFVCFRDTTAPTLERAFDLSARAAWPTDGFEITLAEATGSPQTSHLINYVALKGTFLKKIGLANSPTSDGNTDLDAGFVPLLAMFGSDSLAAHTALDQTSNDGHGLGFGAFDGSSQNLIRFQQDDNGSTSFANSISDTSAVQRLTTPGETPANQGVGVASYPAGNTVRLAWTGVSATARQFFWLALGANASGTTVNLDSADVVASGTASSVSPPKPRPVHPFSEITIRG